MGFCPKRRYQVYILTQSTPVMKTLYNAMVIINYDDREYLKKKMNTNNSNIFAIAKTV